MRPRIVILEPERFPPSALEILRSIGTVILNDDNQDPTAIAKSAEVLVIRLRHFLDEIFLDRSPRLKIISTATTGLDHIDLVAAANRGITVLSLRGETEFLKGVTATAEHAWGLLLALLRHIPEAHASVLKGDWDRDRFFGRELLGRTLGIVGLGRIGQMVARYGLAFRMRVIAHDPYPTDWLDGVAQVADLEELVRSADVLSIHVPLSKETEGLVGRKHFALMKRDVVIVNTSRGAVLDEEALLEALERGEIGGAALDVIQDEYDSASNLRSRLIRHAATHRNLLITPHLGGATFDSLAKVEIFMAQKLANYLKEHPLLD